MGAESSSHTRPMTWLELLLVLSLLLAVFCTGIESVDFMPDESQWIFTSLFLETFLSGEFKSRVWDESYWTLTQPPVTRYVIGLGRRVGGYDAAELNHPWDFTIDYATNLSQGNQPSPELLWWSRLPMAILAALCGLFLFILVSKCAGRLAGYIWLLLFLSNGYLLVMLRRALGESPLLVFITLAALIGDHAVSSWRKAATVKYRSFRILLYPFVLFIVMGVFCGVAVAAKLNGLLTAASGAVLCILTSLRHKGRVPRSVQMAFAVRTSVLLLLVAQLTFVALNPYLYPHPLRHTLRMFLFRRLEMQTQIGQFPAAHIEGIDTRIKVVSQRVFEDYAALRFTGAQVMNLLACTVGLGYLIYTSWRFLYRDGGLSTSIVILLVGLSAATPALFTPLDWDRYYLLPVVFSTICIAIGIAEGLLFSLHWVQHRWTVRIRGF